MSALERDLAAVAAAAFPETPDVAAAVRARIAQEPVPGRGTWRRPLVGLAVAALLVAVLGAAFAVPQARSRILHWLGIAGVRVQFVEQLPPATTGLPPALGVRVSLAVARARVGFHVLVPGRDVGPPDAVYAGHFAVDEVTLMYGRPTDVRLLLTEIAGKLNLSFAGKFVQGDATVRKLTVGGRPALWIEASPHEFLFETPNGQVMSAPLRLDKSTLLWQRGALLLRLEGDVTLAQALRIAAALN